MKIMEWIGQVVSVVKAAHFDSETSTVSISGDDYVSLRDDAPQIALVERMHTRQLLDEQDEDEARRLERLDFALDFAMEDETAIDPEHLERQICGEVAEWRERESFDTRRSYEEAHMSAVDQVDAVISTVVRAERGANAKWEAV